MSGAGRRLSRLPLRLRLVAGFSATMLLVLTGAGAFVYWRVQYALDRRLDTELTDISRVLAPRVTPDGELSDTSTPLAALDVYQVLDARGRVLSYDPGVGPSALLDPSSARAAAERPVRRDIGALLPVSRRPLRVYATPLDRRGQAAVLVVGVRRDQRDEALRELLGQLALAGLGALVLTAFVGERLARRRCGRWSATARRRRTSPAGRPASGWRCRPTATTRSPASGTR